MHAIFTTYLELLAEGNRKDKTIRNNRLSFEKLTTWLDVEGFDAPDLTNIEYKRFVRHLLKDNKASSVGLWHRQIRAAYSHAAELGLVEQNPTAGIGKIIPQQDDEAPHVLNNEELRDVLAACNSDHQRLLVYCFALTGMRSFELARLAWHGTLGNLIDFDAGHIAVIGKKGKHRLVPLHPILAEKLFELRAITGDQPWVFDSRLGGHLHEHSVYMAICNVYERAGIEVEQPTHIFRKSLNTNLTRQGEPLRESCRLQSLRGWSHVKHIEEVRAGGS